MAARSDKSSEGGGQGRSLYLQSLLLAVGGMKAEAERERQRREGA